MDVLSHQRGLFTHSLAGGDRGCGAICRRWSGSTGREVLADGRPPAPQLEAVSQHSKIEFYERT
jgi:hypothetical protein